MFRFCSYECDITSTSFWATVETWWCNMAAPLTNGPAFYENIYFYCVFFLFLVTLSNKKKSIFCFISCLSRWNVTHWAFKWILHNVGPSVFPFTSYLHKPQVHHCLISLQIYQESKKKKKARYHNIGSEKLNPPVSLNNSRSTRLRTPAPLYLVCVIQRNLKDSTPNRCVCARCSRFTSDLTSGDEVVSSFNPEVWYHLSQVFAYLRTAAED